jgi:ribosome maturation factor RimP
VPPRALTPEIEAELAGIADGAGCELLHAEWKGGVLRLILDRRPRTEVSAAPAPAVDAAESLAADGAAGVRSAEATAGAPAAPIAPDTAPVAEAPAAPLEEPAPLEPLSGVSLADCEQVARQASALLDVLDFGGGRYTLEVSSPGLDRQLYRPSDYERFRGRLARLTFESPAPDGRTARRTIVARLAGLADGAAGAAALIDERTGELLTLPLASIRLARLEIEL